MKHLLIAFISLFSISVISCKDDALPEATAVNLRIRNTSDFHYADVYVNTSGGEHHYGDINSNHVSAYHEFDMAYAYAYVELKIGNDPYTLQPIDYFGESELENGYYTYEITAESVGTEHGMSLKLVIDQRK